MKEVNELEKNKRVTLIQLRDKESEKDKLIILPDICLRNEPMKELFLLLSLYLLNMNNDE